MLYEGTRDFIKSYARMGFDPEETVKSEVKKNALPKYLTVFEKVSITVKLQVHTPLHGFVLYLLYNKHIA